MVQQTTPHLLPNKKIAPRRAPYSELGPRGFKDLGGPFLPTKFGAYLINLSSLFEPHRFQRFHSSFEGYAVDLWAQFIRMGVNQIDPCNWGIPCARISLESFTTMWPSIINPTPLHSLTLDELAL